MKFNSRKTFILSVIAFSIVLFTIGIWKFIHWREAKYWSRITKIKEENVERIEIQLGTGHFHGIATFSTDEKDAFVKTFRTFSKMEDLHDRLYAQEVFNVKVVFKDKEQPICFVIVESKKYGGIVTFLNSCDNHMSIMQAKNDALLQLIEKKCGRNPWR